MTWFVFFLFFLFLHSMGEAFHTTLKYSIYAHQVTLGRSRSLMLEIRGDKRGGGPWFSAAAAPESVY